MMKIALLLVGLATVCYGYSKEYIQVYKLVDGGVTMHRLSTQVAEEGKFEPITGENKKNWEISYFSAYKREESISTGSGWSRSTCYFDQEFRICVGNTRLPSGSATRAWFITKKTRCDGSTRTAFSFYAAREECNGAQLIYYATCRNSRRTSYGLVGTKSGLCGSDQTAYEGSFYAYIGKTMCPFMDNPKFGSYKQTWDDFRISSLHYECDPGRELRGPRVITCSDDGRWDQSPPTCEAKKCPALSDPANGRLSSTDFTYQSSVTYECDLGFQLDPPSASVTCQFNGKWTQQRMQCEKVKCDYPRQVENGDIRGDSYEYGKTVEYFCFDPYRLEGAKRATCQANGEWKYEGGKLPSCELIKCDSLGHPKNGKALSAARSAGSSMTFACNTGYKLIGKETLKCMRRGDTAQWNGEMPTCEVITCDRPEAPENGQVLGTDFTYSALVRYMCNPGYVLQGADMSTCQTTGWDGETPTCTAVLCRDPGTPEHGSRVGGELKANSVLTYMCDDGYKLDGAKVLTCSPEGRWSSRAPKCEPVKCPRLGHPSHGSRDGDLFVYPKNVTFSCYPGYEMTGDAVVTCKADGTWSGGLPTCKACPKGSYKVGGSEGKCQKCPAHSSTVSEGSASRQNCICVPGSHGEPGGPCTMVSCEPLKAPENGTMSDCGTTFNEQCLFGCDPGFVLEGSRERKCLSDGWTGNPNKCKACPANSYKMHQGAHSCTPCPMHTRTLPGELGTSINSCKCAPGYKGRVGGPCYDVNECETNNGGCDQECQNLEGSFYCRCNIPGYVLETNKRTCNKKFSCPKLEQDPAYGSKTCRYIKAANGYTCFMKCQKGYFFVSGINNYVTCGQDTTFQWSHRLVNVTSRLPACTREFFVDAHLPLTLSYRVDGACNTTKVDLDKLKERLENTINEIPECNDKCEVEDLTTQCESDKEGETVERVHFNLLLQNKYRYEVPFNCTSKCQYKNLRVLFGNLFKLLGGIKEKVKDEPRKFELDGEGALPLAKEPLSSGKPNLLCEAGKVMTRHRLCAPCDKGFYLNKRSDDHCTACPIGTYQDQQGQTSCKKCHPTTTTLTEGADHLSLCNQRAPAPGEVPTAVPDVATGQEKEMTEEEAEEILSVVA